LDRLWQSARGPLLDGARRPVRLEGDGYDDDAVTRYQWSVIDGPAGATVAPSDAASTDFVAQQPGVYNAQLEVTDTDGASDACVVRISVGVRHGALRPEEITVQARTAATLHAEAVDEPPGP